MRSFWKKTSCFTPFETVLGAFSIASIIIFFCIFDGTNYIALIASLIGTLSLMFNAKGNPLGPGLIIIFSILYGIISFRSRYYGEMITYLGMTLPMAVIALVSWLKNPFNGNKAEVAVNKIRAAEIFFMFALTAAVTIVFYFILKALDNANLIPSTLSVATSFTAAYLTFRRSPYYAVGYAANDVVLIILWGIMAVKDISCLSVVICFAVFLIFDVYGFFSWKKMQLRQAA